MVIILKSLFWLISFLPLPVMSLLGRMIGEVVYWVYGSRRRITHRNLSACFPELSEKKIRKIARQHFHSMTTGMFVMAISWWASEKRLKKLIRVKNPEILQQLIDDKQNIIMLAPHFMGLEILGNYFSTLYKVTSMYQMHKNPAVDKFIYQRRTRFGSEVYNYKDTGPSLIKSIRKGIPFYYLPDQDPGRSRGVFARFYGIETATYPALGKFAKLGKAVVLPCMARLLDNGTAFEVVFNPVLQDYPLGDDVIDSTAMNHAIEELIVHAPAQYFWSHKRFKTRPEGESSFY